MENTENESLPKLEVMDSPQMTGAKIARRFETISKDNYTLTHEGLRQLHKFLDELKAAKS
jgi:hypothetical protein